VATGVVRKTTFLMNPRHANSSFTNGQSDSRNSTRQRFATREFVLSKRALLHSCHGLATNDPCECETKHHPRQLLALIHAILGNRSHSQSFGMIVDDLLSAKSSIELLGVERVDRFTSQLGGVSGINLQFTGSGRILHGCHRRIVGVQFLWGLSLR